MRAAQVKLQQGSRTRRTLFAGIQVMEAIFHPWLNVVFRLFILGLFDHFFLDAIAVHTIGRAVDGFGPVGDGEAELVLLVRGIGRGRKGAQP